MNSGNRNQKSKIKNQKSKKAQEKPPIFQFQGAKNEVMELPDAPPQNGKRLNSTHAASV
ncbi:hypothetical protein [Pseudomonas sp. S2_A02]